MKFLKLFEEMDDYKVYNKNQMVKLNSPTFAYYTLYGKYPDFPIRGKSDSPKKEYNGIFVDENLKNEWLDRLNNLPVEIKSTEEGKDDVRVSHVAFRLYEPYCYDEYQLKEISDKINKYDGYYSSINLGMENKWRLIVCGNNWIDRTTIDEWEQWWEKLLDILENILLK